jgi:DNA-binding transcriptional regulator/RsmH inhibitor MraZ
VDSAGRLKLPARYVEWLDRLEDKSLYVTVVRGMARIYTNGSWERNLEKLNSDRALKREMSFMSDVFGGDVEKDPQGRITLPKALRDLLKLEDQQVQLRFDDDMIFVFPQDRFDGQLKAYQATYEADLDRAEKMGFEC